METTEAGDTLEMDYRSLFGDPAATIDADSQVAAWRAFAGAFDVTQHITGPIVVMPTAGGATARTHVRAYHRIQGASGGDVWTVAGHYLGIPQIARDRASASRSADA
jgi:SnoaL-like protein